MPFKVDNRIINIVDANHVSLYKHLFHISEAFACDLLFVAITSEDKKHARSLLSVVKNKKSANFEFELAQLPNSKKMCHETLVYSSPAGFSFLCDIAPQGIKFERYISIPLQLANLDEVVLVIGLFISPPSSAFDFQHTVQLFGSLLQEKFERAAYETKLKLQLGLLHEMGSISDTGGWEYDIVAQKLTWSDEVYDIYGLPIDTPLTPEVAISFYDGEDQAHIQRVFSDALESGLPYSVELKLVAANGEKKWVKTTGKIEYNAERVPLRVYGAIEDVTKQHKLIADITYKNTRLKNILDNLNDAVVTINQAGIILHVNLVAQQIFGYSKQEMEGQPVSILMPPPYSAKHQHYMSEYLTTGKAKIIGVGRQLPAKRKNGDVFQMELSLTRVDYADDIEFIGIIRDITERIEAQDTIYNLAFVDGLTGLKNKLWFEKECKDILTRGRIQSRFIYAAIIDIDSLSEFNLKYGFNEGNKAIKTIADNLHSRLGEGPHIYKDDANAFIVLHVSTKAKFDSREFDHLKIEQRLLDPDNFLVKVNENTTALSGSIGSCICDTRTNTLESILDTLKYAILQAKESKPFGRYFVDEVGMITYQRMKQINALLENIEQSDELMLVLQPQFDNQGRCIASEALVRWQPKTLGPISPSDFIPLAEKSDAIIKIGDWMLTRVCELLSKLQQSSIDTRIAVNISAKQIMADDFHAKLLAVTERYKVQPHRLMLELTETTLVTDIKLVKRVMHMLKASGFNFSIDDFGTGYSSLSYLKELPIAELKIDKYFVDDILSGNDSAGNIVKVIVDMASALKVECVAEGVETKKQLDFLTQAGCDLYQGYYFSRPLQVQDWLDLLTK
ncbi:hypothetical protein PA25_25320 [Pseudoalteromonas sp. A25]|uniref:sensor domain-containing protein n=1 Tax=Pseudoalteromonas sp. A25 TaxID=116092 RepID=UPI00126097FE|nr:bifunctional diguanylate cyclase/phosphodiesterase [Pseudoalteromonas sp. A25]BBN82547.1 hypothetical protein PA25_25320 [Pseudoalteromonas sp. A25]